MLKKILLSNNYGYFYRQNIGKSRMENMKKRLYFGLDVGSTTVKLVVLDINNNLIYGKYKRHFSDIKNTIINLMEEAYLEFKDCNISIMITGSGGLAVSKWLNVAFIQEVDRKSVV